MKSLFLYSHTFNPSSTFELADFKQNFSNFINLDSKDNFNIEKSNIDGSLDEIVRHLLLDNVYDIIYIPISFGDIYTNFLGLRLAFHIRLTKEINENRFSNIVIYSANNLEEIAKHDELYQILLTKGTILNSLDHSTLLGLLNRNYEKLSEIELKEEVVNKIHLNIPKSYFDSHSIANEWGLYRLMEVANINDINLQRKEVFSKIYFKWLISKNDKIIDHKAIEKTVKESVKELINLKIVGKIDLPPRKKN